MSFGLLKHFKDFKKAEGTYRPPIHHQHVIVGNDLGSILKLAELRKKFPKDQIKLISSRPLSRQWLIDTTQSCLSLLRSNRSLEEISNHFTNLEISPKSQSALFYKEGKFHEFGGRAKPMQLLDGEQFFIEPSYQLSLSSLFSSEDWNNLDDILLEHSEVRIFQTIEKVNANDLINKSEWLLSFKDYSSLTCENLFLEISPKNFMSLLSHKENFSIDLIDFCSSVKVQGAMSINWQLNKNIYSGPHTLFIPQSMTHEWGHFIVEFDKLEESSQSCQVMFLVHEEDPQPEELVGKIKLAKRVLDRVFPKFEESIIKESIRFDEELLLSDFKEASLEQISFDYPHLKFIGQISTLSAEYKHEKFLSRTLLSQ